MFFIKAKRRKNYYIKNVTKDEVKNTIRKIDGVIDFKTKWSFFYLEKAPDKIMITASHQIDQIKTRGGYDIRKWLYIDLIEDSDGVLLRTRFRYSLGMLIQMSLFYHITWISFILSLLIFLLSFFHVIPYQYCLFSLPGAIFIFTGWALLALLAWWSERRKAPEFEERRYAILYQKLRGLLGIDTPADY